MWVVRVYDPTGKYVDTTGRTFMFRWSAARNMQRYSSMRGITVPYQGRQVPLCNYRVERASDRV